uniref:Pleckstrin homology domain-containing family J member 1 n=1 Tax=Sinocyclocheilus anshuiensis TaxID=1608454 RepID=A0A671LTP2_9TELE
MRFNEKELVFLSRQPSERAAELGMRGPKKGDVVKRRLVKLIVNFLFYFRTDEDEPIGALLLEQCRVEREDDHVFSIAFLDEAERKYLFECGSQEQCVEWIDAIVKARTRWSSMGYQTKRAFRSTAVFLRRPHKHTRSLLFGVFTFSSFSVCQYALLYIL